MVTWRERTRTKGEEEEVGRAFPRYCNCSEFCRRGAPLGVRSFSSARVSSAVSSSSSSSSDLVSRETRVDKNVIALSSPRRFTSINLPVTLSRDRDRCEVTSFPNIHRSDLFTPPRKSPFLASPSPLFHLLLASRRLSFSNLSPLPCPSCVFRSRKKGCAAERERGEMMERWKKPCGRRGSIATRPLLFSHSDTAFVPTHACVHLHLSIRAFSRRRAAEGDGSGP